MYDHQIRVFAWRLLRLSIITKSGKIEILLKKGGRMRSDKKTNTKHEIRNSKKRTL